ncbi:hypothetical protein [Cognatilysobacter terrigena]|uniref:hypothetical protein n=1 Tax=Cognatilysobacter terrigena TaxID=2488749 RepID=UPI0010614B20|nr:hypothetical protein [Lysobacter terrigena]
MSIAYEHARDAIAALTGEGTLVDRLALSHTFLARISTDRDLPEVLRPRFDELVADIEYGADSVAGAIALMNETDRRHLADRVIALFADVARAFPKD